MRDGERDRSEWRQRGTVEQSEQEERECDRTEARAFATAAPHDSDANHLVAAAGQCDPTDRGRTAGGGKRQDGRALAPTEEVLPPPCLRGIGGEEDHRREGNEPEVGAVQRPAGVREVSRHEEPDRDRDQDESDVEHALRREQPQRSSAESPPVCTPTL